MKKCTACKKELPDSEFWKKSRKAEGLCPKCKDCTRKAQRIRYHLDPSKYRQRQRDIYHRRKLAGWKQELSPAQKQQQYRRHKAYLLQHPDRQQAKTSVREATKRGENIIRDSKTSMRITAPILIKPPFCQTCGKRTPLQSMHGHHHKGYSNPFDVLFVCRDCHAAITVLERDAVLEGMPTVDGLAKFIKQQRCLPLESAPAPAEKTSLFQRIMKLFETPKGDKYAS